MSIIFIPFLLVLLLVFPLMGKGKNNAKNSLQAKLSFIFLGVLCCFRDLSVGNDTKAYKGIFEAISNTQTDQLDVFSSRFEMGYVYLNKFVANVYDNYFLLQILVAIFAYSVTYRFIKEYAPYVGMAVIIFFFVRFHDDYMNITRQTVATGFTLCAYMRLKQGRDLQFVFLVLLAYTMHKSAIVFLPVWFFTRITYKPAYLKYFVAACGGVFVLGGTIIAYMMSAGIFPSYYEDSVYMEGGKIAPAIQLFMSVCIFLFFYLNKGYRLESHGGRSLYGSDLTWILMMGILIQIAALWFAMMGRVTWYYSIFNVLAVPYALTRIKSQNRLVISACIICFYIAYYYIILAYRPDWNHVYPYKFFF